MTEGREFLLETLRRFLDSKSRFLVTPGLCAMGGAIRPPTAVSCAQVHQGDGSLFHPPDASLWALISPCHPAMRSRPSRYAVGFAQP